MTEIAGGLLAETLTRQGGVISLSQLRRAGVSDGRVRAELTARRWQRVYPRVFAVFTGPVPPQAAAGAAVLFAGHAATLSHLSAGHAQGWLAPPAQTHVTVPHTRRVGVRDGIRVHRSRTLQPVDVVASRWPPRTTVERTVVDCVDTAPTLRRALAVVSDALRARVTTERRLATRLSAEMTTRWRRHVLAALRPVAAGALSVLEIEHARIDEFHGLPSCERQVRLTSAGRVCLLDAVDAFGVVRELDGRLGHEDFRGRWRDMWRDNANTELGRAVLRFGYVDLMERPCEVARQEIRVLRLRGWQGEPRRCGPGCGLGPAASWGDGASP
jgi:hypothetical protein